MLNDCDKLATEEYRQKGKPTCSPYHSGGPSHKPCRYFLEGTEVITHFTKRWVDLNYVYSGHDPSLTFLRVLTNRSQSGIQAINTRGSRLDTMSLGMP